VIEAVDFVGDGNGGCLAVIRLSNGTTINGTAGAAACQEPFIPDPGP
jgi:hypothetical protein